MTDTDTPERELIERLRSPRHSGSGIEDTLLEAADTIEALLSRVDKLEERVRELSSRVKQLANHGDTCDCAECDALNRSAS